MNKRIIALLLVIVLLLCGCGSSESYEVQLPEEKVDLESLEERVTELEAKAENTQVNLQVTVVTEDAEETIKIVVEGEDEPATEPAIEPTTEPTTEPVIEPTTEPATEPAIEPVIEPTTEPTTEPAIEPTTEPAIEPTYSKSDSLDALLNSSYYADWLYVAEDPEATSNHLVKCAQKCADIVNNQEYAGKIAEKLVVHPNANTKVLSELMESKWYCVWLAVAGAECNSSGTLEELAPKCARISNNDTYAEKIAEKLVAHPKTNTKVLSELMESKRYCVWLAVAGAECNNQDSLMKVARKCAGISNNETYSYDIATEILNNPKCTTKIVEVLMDAEYSSVRKLASEQLRE